MWKVWNKTKNRVAVICETKAAAEKWLEFLSQSNFWDVFVIV